MRRRFRRLDGIHVRLLRLHPRHGRQRRTHPQLFLYLRRADLVPGRSDHVRHRRYGFVARYGCRRQRVDFRTYEGRTSRRQECEDCFGRRLRQRILCNLRLKLDFCNHCHHPVGLWYWFDQRFRHYIAYQHYLLVLFSYLLVTFGIRKTVEEPALRKYDIYNKLQPQLPCQH